MTELAAVASSGRARLNAWTTASQTAVTATTRPPQAAGGCGSRSEPLRNTMSTGVKQPSFMGIEGSTKQRTA